MITRGVAVWELFWDFSDNRITIIYFIIEYANKIKKSVVVWGPRGANP